MKNFLCPNCQKLMKSNKDKTSFFCEDCKENKKIKMCPSCQNRMRHIKLPYGTGWKCKCSNWMWLIWKPENDGKPVGTSVMTGIFDLKKMYYWQWFSHTKNYQTFEQDGFETRDLSRKLKGARRVLTLIYSKKKLDDKHIDDMLLDLMSYTRKYGRIRFIKERSEDDKLRVMAGW